VQLNLLIFLQLGKRRSHHQHFSLIGLPFWLGDKLTLQVKWMEAWSSPDSAFIVKYWILDASTFIAQMVGHL
jgi:hypothetical protein